MRVLQSAPFAKPLDACHKKVCVFLLHLGAPKAVEQLGSYLRDTMADTLPAAWPNFFRQRLGHMLAAWREQAATERYERVAGNPHLWRHAEEIRACLEARLILQGYDARALIITRDAGTGNHDALLEARAHAADAHWVVLPLYPQQGRATTDACFAGLLERMSPTERERLTTVRSYANHPLYIDTMAENLRLLLDSLGQAERREVHIVFAAKGVIDTAAQDTYTDGLEASISGITRHIERAPRHTLTFQDPTPHLSGTPLARRSALQPSLLGTLKSLGQAGQRSVIVVPLGCVLEDFDTLHGLDVEACNVALSAGIRHYHRIQSAGADSGFSDVLLDLVERSFPAGTDTDDVEDDDDAGVTRAAAAASVRAVNSGCGQVDLPANV